MTSLRNSSDLNQTLESCPEIQTSANLVFVVLYSLLFVVGSCLNVFSVRVHFGSASRRRSSLSVYLKNLAAADLLLSLSLPIKLAHFATLPALSASGPALSASGPAPSATSPALLIHLFYGSVGATFFYLNMYASILFMGYIAANRYLKILRPLTPHRLQTVRGSWLVSGLTWLVLCVCAGVYAGMSLLSSRSHAPQCSLNCDAIHSPKGALFHVVSHSCLLILFFCVLLALLFFYTSISRRLTANHSRRPQSSSFRNLHRAQRNTRLLLLVFIVCFVPYHMIRLPFVLLGSCFHRPLYLLKEGAVLLSALNVCLDPLLYLLFSQAFRSQLSLKRIFGATIATAITTANANTTTNANSNEARSSDAKSCDVL